MTVIRARWLVLFFVFIWGGYIHCLQPTERWVYAYHGNDDPADSLDYANAIVYGDDGNLYAVGGSKGRTVWGNTDDFVVISLDTAGVARWIYEYAGAHGVYDQAYAVVYGDDGNIYVGGRTSKITWIPSSEAPRKKTDQFACDTVKGAFTIISLQTDSTERWVYTHDSGSCKDIAYGKDDNIYAAGTIDNELFAVISVDTAGNERWVYKNSTWGRANSIVCGEDGNIYAVGVLWGNYGDFAIVCLDTDGNEKWVRTYDGPGYESWDWYCDVARSVVYGNGYVYVAGGIAKSLTLDFTVMKFDSTGSNIWEYYYNGTDNYLDEAYALVYGDDGNIYAAGYSNDGYPGSGRQGCFTVISLTSDGNTNWTYKYFKKPNTFNVATSLAFGLDGNIYAAGATEGKHYDFTVVNLSATGTQQWVYRFDGTDTLYGGGDDVANSIVYGPDSFLYIAGYNDDSVTQHDFTVISLGNRKPKPDTTPPPHNSFGQMGSDGLSDLTFCLYQNIPNPFTRNNGTEIRYAVPHECHVKLSIYNCAGQCVETLVDRTQASGVYSVVWRGQDDAGKVLPQGIYFCTIVALPVGETKSFCDMKKLLLLR